MEGFRQRALEEMGIGPVWIRRRSPLAAADVEAPEPSDALIARCDSLEVLAELISPCTRCTRCMGRTRALPGRGDAHAAMMVIDLVPSQADAATGAALSADAGRLFEQMLFAIGLKRGQVYLTHVLRCDGASPTSSERAACSAFLARDIELVAPRVIVVLAPARAAVEDLPEFVFSRTTRIDLPHPAELIADPRLKPAAWTSLLAARDALAATVQ